MKLIRSNVPPLSVRPRRVSGRALRVQWQRHFSLDDGIDGLSSDDHQLETIILRTNLLTAVQCTTGRLGSSQSRAMHSCLAAVVVARAQFGGG